ncbi:hypothetical protein VPH35_129908 [Triticum aestivum]|uniref:serine/threonine-protein kinase STY46 n=1 Tax=Triticum aestivum TaxID=4565 RepID=UPI000844C56D|nr:serine/threonine-protein kinase STY46-like [Triticum aestivum]
MEDGEAAAVRMMHHRLVATGKSHEPLSSFSHHFDRLPRSYLHTRCVGSPEDVLLDQKLLADTEAKKRLVAHARLMHRVQVHYDDDGGGYPRGAQPPLPELRSSRSTMQDENFTHEITFASRDKPKLLSQLSALMYGVGFHVHEAHIFTTTDGFCLSIFNVDGWPQEDVKGLLEAIKDEMIRENIYI